MAAIIPEVYGGSGLGLTEASVILEEVNRYGGSSGSVHDQMYHMGTLLRHGSKAQKEMILPKIATGELRLQTMAVSTIENERFKFDFQSMVSVHLTDYPNGTDHSICAAYDEFSGHA